MKTTASRLIGGLAFLATCSPAIGWANPPAGSIQAWLGRAAVGDDGSASPADQADDFLRQARSAMANHNYELADHFISSAEQINPHYSIFHTGDTPKKCRTDLNRLLGLRPDGSSYTPANNAPQVKPTGPADPFHARDAAMAAAGQPTGGAVGDPRTTSPESAPPMRLPPVDHSMQPTPLGPAMANYPSTGLPPIQVGPGPNAMPEGPTANLRAQSDALLLAARKRLAYGDTRGATNLVDQATTFHIRYAETDDSPANVAALIHRYADMKAQADQNHAIAESDGFRHQYAGLLMEEAGGLMMWREFDEAERLNGMARQMPVQYSPVEMRPEMLAQRIAAARQGGGAPQVLHVSGGAALGLPTTGDAQPSAAGKAQAAMLTQQARGALNQGNLPMAEQLARQADGMAPDSAFAPQEDRPSLVLFEIQKARLRAGQGVVTAGGEMPADGGPNLATRSIYNPDQDRTHVVQTSGPEELPAVRPAFDPSLRPAAGSDNSVAGQSPAMQLFAQGEKALSDGNRDEALRLFRQAYAAQDQLDAGTRQRLQDHLQLLSVPAVSRQSGPNDGVLEGAAAHQLLLARQIASDVSRLQTTAQQMRSTDPKGGLVVLQKARSMVEQAPPDFDPQARQVLLHRVDDSIHEMQAYIQQNLAQITLNEENQRAHEDVDHRRQMILEVGQKLAQMVDEFNKLIDERRYAEAELVAKRAAEMDPKNPVVHQMVATSKALRREAENMEIKDEKEGAIVDNLLGVDKSSIPFHGEPFQFGKDAHEWEAMTANRHKFGADATRRRSPGDIEIEQKLSTPVSMKFKQAPLGEVLAYLQKVTQVNMHVDPQGLQAEGVSTDQPVTIDLASDIQLKSALALILEPLHLAYVIKNEVLEVTSEDKRHGQVYTVSYQVADLVIPIPNFGPNGKEGINAALSEGYNRLGYGGANGSGGFAGPPVAVFANDNASPTNAKLNPAVAAQIQKLGVGGIGGLPATSNGVQTGQPQPSGYGPGGLKGGNQADFDSLIDLITSTIAPQSWDSAGGAGSIAPFQTNLTLVVSQTQEVHEQIADLLNQLRRLQDLQVTIEVRFITLDDNFFERIGVDFNFNIPVNSPLASGLNGVSINQQFVPQPANSNLIGLAPGSSSTSGYNISSNVMFQQGSFGAAQVPVFPGLNVDTTPASFGFAILSDIQAFFVIQAVEGDDRSNVLQAPKVTLFNGQQAFVSDTSQRPFVTSVIPVVGDFAAAQQPVITVLSEGTSLSVQAVVSPDRRFVRLTVVPFFSQIGDVQNFQFTGSTTTVNNSASSTNGTGAGSSTANTGSTVTNEGTTVQLPTFNFVTVTTTVSVPDGGTVLLGGIKRLSEGRTERGVPILSKIPYINRLFKNTAIGRTTESLMMMVTPRIIIQEEEEAKLLGTQP